MPQEPQVFLSENGVRVTSTLVQIAGETYSTSNITSFRMTVANQAFTIALAIIFFLVALAIFAKVNLLCGFVTLALGALGLLQKNELYIVTAGGERKALTVQDRAFCERVHKAVIQAMHAQGR